MHRTTTSQSCNIDPSRQLLIQRKGPNNSKHRYLGIRKGETSQGTPRKIECLDRKNRCRAPRGKIRNRRSPKKDHRRQPKSNGTGNLRTVPTRPGKKNHPTSTSSHGNNIGQLGQWKKEKQKTKKKAKATDFFEIPPPLQDQEDKDLLTQTSDEPSDSDDTDDEDAGSGGGSSGGGGRGGGGGGDGGGCGSGDGGPKKGKEPSPPPPPPPMDHEVFAALLVQILKKVIPMQKQDTGRRLPVKAPETFNGEFVKFRGWWKSMQRYLRIYASHIPDDTTRINVVSTYFKDDDLLWYKARERLLDLPGSQDSWKAFSSKLEEQFTNKQEIAKDYKRILALKYEGSIQTFFAKLDKLNSRV